MIIKLNLLLSGLALTILSCGNPNKTTSIPKQIAADPTVYGQTITANELKEHLYIYASDEFEGRDTGAPGQKKAVAYLKNEYLKLNIPSPLGGQNYYQKVLLEKQFAPDTKITLNQKELIPFEDFITFGSPKTQTLNAQEIVYVGYGIDDVNYSDYKTIEVLNKIVLAKAGEPKNEDGTYVTTGKTEATKWSSRRQWLREKLNAAAKNGAKGIIFLDADNFSAIANFYKRSAKSGKASIGLVEHTNELPQFFISQSVATQIYPNIIKDDSPKNIKSTIDIAIKSNAEPVDSENVVAFIKGTEKPDEILVLSAHLDHVGMTDDGEVFNGADDDGSGTVALLEIAEAFKKAVSEGHGPKRSILFLHVTGEERGLLGSQYYADKDPLFPLKNTVANLNIDMIGRVDPEHENNRNYIYLIGSDRLSTDLHNISEAANDKYTQITLDYKYNALNDPNRFYSRSDHYNFAKHNIPVIFYFNGTHADYHKTTDTPDKIDYELLQNRTRLVFYTAWEIANRAERPKVNKATTTP